MNKRDQPTKGHGKLEEIAQLTNDDIIARSVVSGVIFVIVLTILDLILGQPVNLWQTFTLGLILSGVLCAFDLFIRANARKKIK